MTGTADYMQLGRAGELRVASELLLRGHSPSLSLVDRGIDLICDCGKTVQVKTSSLISTKGRPGQKLRNRYSFNFTNWHKQAPTVSAADLVVCWAVGTESFWVFSGPETLVRQININPLTSTYDFALNRWSLFD